MESGVLTWTKIHVSLKKFVGVKARDRVLHLRVRILAIYIPKCIIYRNK